MTKRHENITTTIGSTPIVRLKNIEPEGVKLYAKLESFNPGGSVKDRLALGVIEAAEASGDLKPGQTVVEATSGNTGIGLAVVCAQRGYPLVVVMAENFSVERRKLLRFLGAKVVLTPAAEKGTGMLRKAEELAGEHGWFLARQFENEANADMHSRTTAPEILRSFDGEALNYWVTGFGTGGTLKGVARVLKQERPDTKIIACEPDNAPVLAGGLPQPKTDAGNIAASHPSFRPHVMQGWAPDFISALTEWTAEGGLIDEVVGVAGQSAMDAARDLARREGILVGITGGATLAGALEVARKAPKGSTILCMLPDTGERYLSTPLFEDIGADMDEAELDISRSTPFARFDAPPPAPAKAPSKPSAPVAVDPAAAAFVDEVLSDKDQPVVMFALEWCEFCWSVRRLFKSIGVDYRSIDLDSAENQADNWGGRVRAALNARTGGVTIPQIFIGGTYIGGCTELLDACNNGEMEKLLAGAGIVLEQRPTFDAYEYLPKWLQTRMAS